MFVCVMRVRVCACVWLTFATYTFLIFVVDPALACSALCVHDVFVCKYDAGISLEEHAEGRRSTGRKDVQRLLPLHLDQVSVSPYAEVVPWSVIKRYCGMFVELAFICDSFELSCGDARRGI